MVISASGALAVELHLHSPTHWVVTYYPMVQTPAGRWADVTWVLHRSLIPATLDRPESTRWLEVRSSDPAHPCYTGHPAWARLLAIGYTAALAAYEAEAVEEPLSVHEVDQLKSATVVVPPEQLSEWVLDDLEDEPSPAHD
ncbi:hypothetical protein AS25_11395 [Kocuria marina]|uniref:Uncharacterized protein n=1 Tax=Kocuria marina TaxID=223184 RepID=A0A0B0D8D7_9MICC|nr:hypothetical protein [Kocuria marina]KHE73683.1 hypothetical protein AS25_11395 [Kocuria marina]